ncbi:ankyrin repeat-containing protein [Penicillium sp. CMV-2018d]|nr:ankyrin repeat-containing protein [Penicillium sp. CMV-2018d]
MIENRVINVAQEELKIASLCLGYLALPGFEAVLAEPSVEDLLKIGYYAFVDYAACYWTSHLRAGLTHGVPEQSTGKIIGHIQRFIGSHHRSCDEDFQISAPTRNLLSCLQESDLGSCDGFENFLQAFVATELQVETYSESAASNNALDIPDIIARIRAILEDVACRKSCDDVDYKSFVFFYGEAIYKCSRMSCSYFHRGFISATEREAHVRKHNLPYTCSYPGCLRGALGFSSARELQRHVSQSHEMAQTKGQMFPSKQKRPALQCGICQQSFNKPGLLRTHDCSKDNSTSRSLHGSENPLPLPEQQDPHNQAQNGLSTQQSLLAMEGQPGLQQQQEQPMIQPHQHSNLIRTDQVHKLPHLSDQQKADHTRLIHSLWNLLNTRDPQSNEHQQAHGKLSWLTQNLLKGVKNFQQERQPQQDQPGQRTQSNNPPNLTDLRPQIRTMVSALNFHLPPNLTQELEQDWISKARLRYGVALQQQQDRRLRMVRLHQLYAPRQREGNMTQEEMQEFKNRQLAIDELFREGNEWLNKFKEQQKTFQAQSQPGQRMSQLEGQMISAPSTEQQCAAAATNVAAPQAAPPNQAELSPTLFALDPTLDLLILHLIRHLQNRHRVLRVHL